MAAIYVWPCVWHPGFTQQPLLCTGGSADSRRPPGARALPRGTVAPNVAAARLSARTTGPALARPPHLDGVAALNDAEALGERRRVTAGRARGQAVRAAATPLRSAARREVGGEVGRRPVPPARCGARARRPPTLRRAHVSGVVGCPASSEPTRACCLRARSASGSKRLHAPPQPRAAA